MYINDYRGCHGMMNTYQPSMELISLLVEAMKDERADRAKYGKMMEMTDDKKVKRQIQFAYDDEGKHYKMFQHIYHLLTGQMINVPLPEEKEHHSLVDAIESSIDGELEAVELYRKIKSLLPNRHLRDMLYEIITDEQEHATRFVYLYAMLHHMEHHMANHMEHGMEDHMENHMHHCSNDKENMASNMHHDNKNLNPEHTKENYHKSKHCKKRMSDLW